ncbi:MAG: DNA mismatch repair endonuclease MutL, partial [Gemmatimonadota bacterium]|nr:DNA mismatch repair endonuclease MutL [Gemmatimonadota bacterium]
MSRIAVLPRAVADQIAAGEVVERPASVVKELLENALDAGATSVDIVAEDGGRRRIRVSDDGSGMDRDDAQLALERHATSKIRRPEDLVGVASFGFRGEALPSICSVSEFLLETAAGDGSGTRVRATGGRLLGVDDVARRRGTTVEVTRLFYNAPARQKFLRSARAEWRGVVDAVTNVALTRRDVRLTVTHDGKSVLTLPRATTLRARLAALWGASFADRLLDVDDVSGPLHVSGLVERPADVGASSRRVFIAVNGRPVRDSGLVRAAEAAYRSTIPAGARPTVLLEITAPAEDVDVNVHPAKAEVRFRDRWVVERATEVAVRRALGPLASGHVWRARYAPAGPVHAWNPVEGAHAQHPFASDVTDTGFVLAGSSAAVAAPTAPAAAADAGRDGPARPTVEVPPLVQLRRTYLLFERADAVVLIDQHSAHERILFEQFMRAFEQGGAPSQQLLLPLTVHLAPAEEEAFEEHRDLFARLGFDAEPFGGTAILVRAVPAPHPRFDAERCLRDTLAVLTGDRLAGVAARHERLAATFACKAAIKAGEPLAQEEMRALFVALSTTALPAHDVHGRC